MASRTVAVDLPSSEHDVLMAKAHRNDRTPPLEARHILRGALRSYLEERRRLQDQAEPAKVAL